MFLGLSRDNGTFDTLSIYLTGNQITRVQKGVFASLNSSFVTQLLLAQNRITEVEDSAFSRLNQLRILHLNENRNRVLGKLTGLVSLQTLYLWNNKLTTLSTDVLEDVPRPLTLILGMDPPFLQQLQEKSIRSHTIEVFRNEILLARQKDLNVELILISTFMVSEITFPPF